MPRQRISEDVKRLTGVNSRPARTALVVDGKLAEPPVGLTKDAKSAWRMALECAPDGMITALDHAVLERWARAYALFRKISKQLEHEDVLTPAGDLSPRFNAYVKMQTVMLALEKELGFTPVARARVPARPAAANDGNPFIEEA